MAPLAHQYAKLCDLADFADPGLASLIGEITPEHSADRPHRKAWEFAMGARFLQEVGRTEGDAEVLDVGAGADAILFWLANRVRRVVATDIYGRGAFGQREADISMLNEPASFAAVPFPAERLEVLDMDARELAFDDESFDVVVSFSSIEHFGGPSGITAAAREIGRVLRPGGHAFIVTECYVDRHALERAPIEFAARLATFGRRAPTATLRRRVSELLTPAELRRHIVRPSGLTLMQPLDLTVSPASRENVQTVHPDSTVTSTTGDPYPHVLMAAGRSTFTSACLPLVKAH